MIKIDIEKIMKKNIKNNQKIYQASKDGDTPEIFHTKCDNINNTLVYINQKEIEDSEDLLLNVGIIKIKV